MRCRHIGGTPQSRAPMRISGSISAAIQPCDAVSQGRLALERMYRRIVTVIVGNNAQQLQGQRGMISPITIDLSHLFLIIHNYPGAVGLLIGMV